MEKRKARKFAGGSHEKGKIKNRTRKSGHDFYIFNGFLIRKEPINIFCWICRCCSFFRFEGGLRSR